MLKLKGDLDQGLRHIMTHSSKKNEKQKPYYLIKNTRKQNNV